MSSRCFRACFRTNDKAFSYSNGWRATFYYPGGGTYLGYWHMNQRHHYGVQTTPKGVIYDGQWQHDKRHGNGTLRRKSTKGDHTYERIYMGEWRNDRKSGEGKQYYPEGVYYGWWQEGLRHGLGLMLYNDDNVYMGEWKEDLYHGIGVLIYPNGNRYEGCFARGYKHGEGTFYHMQTGQVQKGMWQEDVCKTSLIQDEFRNQAKRPTEYPIPKCGLWDPDNFVRRIFSKYTCKGEPEAKHLAEWILLNFVKRNRFYAKLESSGIWHTKVPFIDIKYPCVCKANEKLVILKER